MGGPSRARRARLEDWYLAVQLLLDHNDRKALSAQEMEDKLSKFLSSDTARNTTPPRLASELFLRGILRNFWDIDKLLGKVNPGDELQRYARSPMVLSILRVMAYELMWLPNSTVLSAKQSVEELMDRCELRFNHEKEWISNAVTRLCKSFERSHQDSDRKGKLREERKRMLKEQGGDVPAARPKASVPGGVSKRRNAALCLSAAVPPVARSDIRRPKGAVPCAAVEDEAIVETTTAAVSAIGGAAAGTALAKAPGAAPAAAKTPEVAPVGNATTPKAKPKASPLPQDNVEEVVDEEPAALITLVDDSPNRSEDEKEADGAVEAKPDVQVIKDEGKVLPVEDGEDEEEVLDECESDEEEEEEDQEEEDVVELEDEDGEADVDDNPEVDADADEDDDADEDEEEEPCEIEEDDDDGGDEGNMEQLLRLAVTDGDADADGVGESGGDAGKASGNGKVEPEAQEDEGATAGAAPSDRTAAAVDVLVAAGLGDIDADPDASGTDTAGPAEAVGEVAAEAAGLRGGRST